MPKKLEQTKRLAEKVLKEQINLQKKLMELDYNQITEFNQWYRTHPYQQELENVVKSIDVIKNQLKQS